MTTADQLAMCHVIEKLHAGDSFPLAAMTALFPPPGLTVTTDWPVLLGASEEQIIEVLAEYYEREMDRFAADVRRCDTQISQDLLPLMANWREECGSQWARQQAMQTWQRYAA